MQTPEVNYCDFHVYFEGNIPPLTIQHWQLVEIMDSNKRITKENASGKLLLQDRDGNDYAMIDVNRIVCIQPII